MLEAPVTRDEIENAPIKAKIRAAEEIVKQTLEDKGPENTVVEFEDARDSTVTTWIVRNVCEENDFEKPEIYLEEQSEFAEALAEGWGFTTASEKDAEAVIRSDRWETGGNEDFYTPGQDSLIVRPILQLETTDVWDVTWFHMIPDETGVGINSYPETREDLPEQLDAEELPVAEKYWEGDEPAWLQDPEEQETEEQGPDAEKVKDKLRDLGYM
ncbi:MAG: hypothetical protein ABEK00_00905 [Candidatus Nanohaloarchaea archaeon]